MDVIQAARELGKAIQADDRFIKMSMAQEKSDQDQELQGMIQSFNQERAALNSLLQDREANAEAIPAQNEKIKQMYEQVFQNENMAAFTAARGEMEQLMEFVNQIVTGSTQGQNPDTIQFQESCGGQCGGCSGCS